MNYLQHELDYGNKDQECSSQYRDLSSFRSLRDRNTDGRYSRIGGKTTKTTRPRQRPWLCSSSSFLHSLLPSSPPQTLPNNPSHAFPHSLLLLLLLLSSLSFPITSITRPLRLRSLRPRSSLSDDEEYSGEDAPKVTDEWGEKSDPEPESSYTKFSDSDEWGKDGYIGGGGISNGGGVSNNGGNYVIETETETKEEMVKQKLLELKRCLVDSVYGSELGFRARLEERAEILELVNQLEALNPRRRRLKHRNFLIATSFCSVATFGSTLQAIIKSGEDKPVNDTSNHTIVNSTTLSGPLSTFSFSATATSEVRSPSRIQVQFMEGSFQPPEIKSSVELPGEVDIFGQKINLSPLQQILNPIQEAVANISWAISGQPPLRLPIPGERTKSWLLTTYLDEDFRISRGDGGLFVLAKEGSPFLYQ